MTNKLTQYYFNSIPIIVSLRNDLLFYEPNFWTDIIPIKPLFSPKVGVWDYRLTIIFSGDKYGNLLYQMGSQYNEVSSNENHTGPGAVGNKTPTRDVIIQMIIAIINE